MIYKLLVLAYFTEYFRPQDYVPILGAVKITTLLPVVVIGVSLIAASGKDRISNGIVLRHRNTQLMLFFMLMLCTQLAMAIFDSSKVATYVLNKLDVTFAYFLLFFVTAKEVTSIERMKGIFASIILAHLLIVLLNPETVTRPEVRSYLVHAYLGDGNDFAMSLGILVPMCLFLFQDTQNKILKILALLVTLFLVLGIIGTSSRGGTLALACLFFYQWWRGRQKVLGILGFAVVVGVVLIYAPPMYFERMETIRNYQEEGSAMGRITAWKAAVHMAIDNPLTGVGPGHFNVAFGTKYMPEGAEGHPWLTAHSIYFLALGELGIPGLVFILVAVFATLLKSDRQVKRYQQPNDEHERRIRQISLCMTTSMVAYGAAGAFLSALYYPHLFVLLGLYIAMDNSIKRELGEQETISKDAG